MSLFCCRDADNSIVEKDPGVIQVGEVELKRCHPPVLAFNNFVKTKVHLNVYSLVRYNNSLKKIGMGVFHTGVVVYGIEWGYGESMDPEATSGLFCVYPGQAAGMLYRTIYLGVTTHSPEQVDTILHRLENEWRSSDYHILNHNCNHFSQRFCDLLTTVEKLKIPSWCNRAARFCGKVVPSSLASFVHRLIDEAPPRAPPMTPTRISELPKSIIPQDWYRHPAISQRKRYFTPYESEQECQYSTKEAEKQLENEDDSVFAAPTRFTGRATVLSVEESGVCGSLRTIILRKRSSIDTGNILQSSRETTEETESPSSQEDAVGKSHANGSSTQPVTIVTNKMYRRTNMLKVTVDERDSSSSRSSSTTSSYRSSIKVERRPSSGKIVSDCPHEADEALTHDDETIMEAQPRRLTEAPTVEVTGTPNETGSSGSEQDTSDIMEERWSRKAPPCALITLESLRRNGTSISTLDQSRISNETVTHVVHLNPNTTPNDSSSGKPSAAPAENQGRTFLVSKAIGPSLTVSSHVKCSSNLHSSSSSSQIYSASHDELLDTRASRRFLLDSSSDCVESTETTLPSQNVSTAFSANGSGGVADIAVPCQSNMTIYSRKDEPGHFCSNTEVGKLCLGNRPVFSTVLPERRIREYPDGLCDPFLSLKKCSSRHARSSSSPP
uniref:Uncharacterized protein TCIL3000_11_5560 n=1 Tax=Trypanosoma congolense (strain IL3000) TaxID=1068625 RepID=G0V0H1_TRYCI|nr:unnamed protein product [Trypanosoma congolense IL3000]